MTTGGGNTITWSSYNKPLLITDSTGNSSQFKYGPSRARYWHEAITEDGNKTTTTLYVGGSYERVTDNTGTQHRYFVRAGGQVIAVHKEQTNAQDNSTADLNGDGVWIEYLHRNHQGSIVAITNSAGDLLARYSYDAWGKRRSPVSWDTSPAGQFLNPDSYTTRGYTGHEHLDHLGLIHMNGRVYAPEIGRFLSADPFTQFPESTQGLNRYSYVGNNPMSYTDPSGHFIVATIAAIAIAAAETWYVAAIIGAVAGYLTTGTLEGALLGAASAAIGFGIGQLGWNAVATTFARGITQAAIADIAGGNFANAFKLSLISQQLKGLIPEGPMGVVVAAAIGGTVTDIGGGKFANGALTAAFVYAAKPEGASAASATGSDITDAKLAQGVYDPNFKGADGYKVVKRFTGEAGLQAALFVKGDDYVLAFAGTDPSSWANWKANLGQAFGFESAQYEAGINLAIDIKIVHPNVRFTGHSLGGGIASAAAVITGGSATTFNAAGVHNNTLRDFSRTNGAVRAYYSTNDVLRIGNAFTPASVIGQKISLGAAGFHGMDGVCQAMGC